VDRYPRKKTRQIMVGTVPVGGDAPVTVQSMTTTKTADVEGTLAQIYALKAAGADIVRCTCNEREAAEGLARIVPRSPVPIVADIHFHVEMALAAIEAGVHCLRLNPGNLRKPEEIKLVARECKDRDIPVRIGVNGGSLDKRLYDKYGGATPEALVESAQIELGLFAEVGFDNVKISVKGPGHGGGLPSALRGGRPSFAPWPDRGRPASCRHHQGHSGDRHAAHGGHRGHDPVLVDHRPGGGG
jgi:(E)-4-hydroxy-3-methylbut-2-enyl-diphosphate synthase